MKIKAWIKVYDQKGKLIARKRANSLVKAFIQGLYIQMSASTFTVTDITGVGRSIGNSTSALYVGGGTGNTNLGIVVGTGTDPVDINQFKLQSQISHGTGAGQLSYGGTSVGIPYIVGNKAGFVISRTFTNQSGANITVNEVGLYGHISASYYFMFDRTLMSITIPNGESRTFAYEIWIQV